MSRFALYTVLVLLGRTPCPAQTPAPANPQAPAAQPPANAPAPARLQPVVLPLRWPSLSILPASLLDPALHLTAMQQTQINDIRRRLRDEGRGILPAPGAYAALGMLPPAVPPQARPRRRQPTTFERILEREAEASGQLNAVLTPAQRTIAGHLVQDACGFAAAGIAPGVLNELQNTLALNDTQRATLNDAARTADLAQNAAFTRAQKEGDAEAMTRAATELQSAARAKIFAVLSADQRTAIEKGERAWPSTDTGQTGL